ncbi:Glyoxalase/bleomycin resistance protein/dioxygenase [Thermosinus carboxydivorans Nor1]|uniref:Glyoxalase/bleomycin resistance protein/dioxygenase n=2 Tax=Sporomusaceae TaxID=1843490 RepID=A1HP31_9FIRM|nr:MULTISPECIES: methylmalonyl-CoA epimerase [Sporomusaceae]EAX48139.1 Glyoxalase/bleomycin resistance protein/dioxygenase [Thermosinus carboxydivorans Nor1]SDF20568.1 methylmalonyl-CoA epimerase [Sporolituus thermophilus DSM 23256]
MFKVLKVDHIGIAVKDLEQAKKFYTEVLGMEAMGEEVVAEQKVKVCFIPCGDSEVELLESTSPDGPIAKFIEKNGEGIQHIALRVDNIENALADLKAKGVRLIDEKPRYGAGGASIAFLHPKATGGVLLELSERK